MAFTKTLRPTRRHTQTRYRHIGDHVDHADVIALTLGVPVEMTADMLVVAMLVAPNGVGKHEVIFGFLNRGGLMIGM